MNKKLEELKAKAEDGEYSEGNSEIEGADLCTIGEMAASAYGWL